MSRNRRHHAAVLVVAGLGVGAVAALFVAYPVLWVPVVALGYYALYVLAFALPLYAYYEIEYRVRRYRWRAARARALRAAARPAVVPLPVPALPRRPDRLPGAEPAGTSGFALSERTTRAA